MKKRSRLDRDTTVSPFRAPSRSLCIQFASAPANYRSSFRVALCQPHVSLGGQSANANRGSVNEYLDFIIPQDLRLAEKQYIADFASLEDSLLKQIAKRSEDEGT